MALTEDEMRVDAWQQAVHAEGTRAVFDARARKLQRLTRTRDTLAVFVWILVAAVFGFTWFEQQETFRAYALWSLYVASTIQLLLAGRSLVANWDAELAYFIRASRDSLLQNEQWIRIGKGDASSIEAAYKITQERQAILNSHDAEKHITAKEKKLGLRSGLILLQKPCVCGVVPRSEKPPSVLFISTPCHVCGGN